jgi:hypothetical protein
MYCFRGDGVIRHQGALPDANGAITAQAPVDFRAGKFELDSAAVAASLVIHGQKPPLGEPA